MLVDEALGRTSSQLIPTYNQPRPASFLPSLAALSRPQFPTFDPTKVRNASSIEAIPKNFTQTGKGQIFLTCNPSGVMAKFSKVTWIVCQ